jgi:hypothetical protein
MMPRVAEASLRLLEADAVALGLLRYMVRRFSQYAW